MRYGLGHMERQKYGASTYYWPKEMLPFVLAACTQVVLEDLNKEHFLSELGKTQADRLVKKITKRAT